MELPFQLIFTQLIIMVITGRLLDRQGLQGHMQGILEFLCQTQREQ